MDIRRFPGPLGQSLAAVNARHPWNHNEHFHDWILRSLPASRRAAVDIGCGTGLLAAKLATRFGHVTGVERNKGMADAASARLSGFPRVTIYRGEFADFSSTAGNGSADLITMVAVLHHLDLEDTLGRIPRLLAPGGRLLVIGLARSESLADLAFDVVSSAADPVMGMIKHPRPVRAQQRALGEQPAMPMMDPSTTLAEITTAARTLLPGSAVRRRLFFRYTLRWDKPR